MKNLVRFALLLTSVVALAGCRDDKDAGGTVTPRDSSAGTEGGGQTDGPGGQTDGPTGDASTGPYSGDIRGLRMSNPGTGTMVQIPQAIVVGLSGNNETLYI